MHVHAVAACIQPAVASIVIRLCWIGQDRLREKSGASQESEDGIFEPVAPVPVAKTAWDEGKGSHGGCSQKGAANFFAPFFVAMSSVKVHLDSD
jgi:hypothetical protein